MRWVTDSARYNEWCNPIDYETEEALAEQERLGLVLPQPEAAGAGAAPAFAGNLAMQCIPGPASHEQGAVRAERHALTSRDVAPPSSA